LVAPPKAPFHRNLFRHLEPTTVRVRATFVTKEQEASPPALLARVTNGARHSDHVLLLRLILQERPVLECLVVLQTRQPFCAEYSNDINVEIDNRMTIAQQYLLPNINLLPKHDHTKRSHEHNKHPTQQRQPWRRGRSHESRGRLETTRCLPPPQCPDGEAVSMVWSWKWSTSKTRREDLSDVALLLEKLEVEQIVLLFVVKENKRVGSVAFCSVRHSKQALRSSLPIGCCNTTTTAQCNRDLHQSGVSSCPLPFPQAPARSALCRSGLCTVPTRIVTLCLQKQRVC
jgi:hypothetical protein